jgi:ubiquitin-like protein Pup
MATQKRSPSSNRTSDEALDTTPVSAGSQTSNSSLEVDAMLEEIDTVLEQNAEEFVKSFIQKGGQ